MWPLLIFSHILGDYFFQTTKMASLKSQHGAKGLKACVQHSTIYMLCICIPIIIFYNVYLSSFIIAIIFPIAIFLSHYPIDRYALADKYIQKIKGGPDRTHPFYPIIYVIIDNSSHLFLMYIILKIMGFPI